MTRAPDGAFTDFREGGWQRMGFDLTDAELERVLDASTEGEYAAAEQVVDERTTAQGIEFVPGSVHYQFYFRQVAFTGRSNLDPSAPNAGRCTAQGSNPPGRFFQCRLKPGHDQPSTAAGSGNTVEATPHEWGTDNKITEARPFA